jgi:hypothetical protein
MTIITGTYEYLVFPYYGSIRYQLYINTVHIMYQVPEISGKVPTGTLYGTYRDKMISHLSKRSSSFGRVMDRCLAPRQLSTLKSRRVVTRTFRTV